MSLSEIQPKRLAHTLFLDFVGYSRLTADSQAAVQVVLQNLVYNLPAFQAARNDSQLMVRKTGDGMAVVFFQDIEFPLAAAVALDEVIKHQSSGLREQVGAPFRLRMGIHSGPVVIVDEDGDGIMDVAGEGINIAQRVMDCGDEGHILVSAAVFNAVAEKEHWKSLLHDLGIVRVKHDELVHLYNLTGQRPDSTIMGFEGLPRKVHEARARIQQLVEQENNREQTENRATLTNYALRAALLVGAFVLVGSLLFLLWRNSTINSGEVKHVAEVIRKNKLAQENKNKTAPAVTLATPAPTNPSESASAIVHARVPNVVGMQRTDAEKALAGFGLTLSLSPQTPEVGNATVPAGSIVNQSPPPGEQNVRGGVVYVTLAKGAGTPVAPTPEPPPQSAYTGVLVDGRSFTQLANAQTAGLFGPNDAPLYSAASMTSDEVEAIQQAGINPLRLTAIVAGPNGVGLSAEDVEKLRALPETIRAKTVILRP
ncbi:MAG: PASTA domain-containing protein [Armatimonadetes bacterium]|nr:PASTA domain-containing protein [Armatimonadota bacterium]